MNPIKADGTYDVSSLPQAANQAQVGSYADEGQTQSDIESIKVDKADQSIFAIVPATADGKRASGGSAEYCFVEWAMAQDATTAPHCPTGSPNWSVLPISMTLGKPSEYKIRYDEETLVGLDITSVTQVQLVCRNCDDGVPNGFPTIKGTVRVLDDGKTTVRNEPAGESSATAAYFILDFPGTVPGMTPRQLGLVDDNGEVFTGSNGGAAEIILEFTLEAEGTGFGTASFDPAGNEGDGSEVSLPIRWSLAGAGAGADTTEKPCADDQVSWYWVLIGVLSGVLVGCVGGTLAWLRWGGDHRGLFGAGADPLKDDNSKIAAMDTMERAGARSHAAFRLVTGPRPSSLGRGHLE